MALRAMIGVWIHEKRKDGPPPPRKRIVERTFMKIIFEYSARKKSANGPPAYSTLNPDTNSDSPSVRSKGVRFVSASVETYQINAIGVQVKTNHEKSWLSEIDDKLKLPARITTHSTINPKLTS